MSTVSRMLGWTIQPNQTRTATTVFGDTHITTTDNTYTCSIGTGLDIESDNLETIKAYIEHLHNIVLTNSILA